MEKDRMKRTGLILLILLALIQPALGADFQRYSVPLSGVVNEALNQGDPDGGGQADFQFNLSNNQICYEIQVVNIDLPATAAQIRRGTDDVTGDSVIPITPPDASGYIKDCITPSSGLFDEIAENPGGFYLNIENRDFPAGAMRGQLARFAFNDTRLSTSMIWALYANADGIEVLDAQGQLLLNSTLREIRRVAANPAEAALIETANGVSLYRLTSGEFQVNIGPDAEGKVEVHIFNRLPTRLAYRRDFSTG
jgi:hypothetical protein